MNFEKEITVTVSFSKDELIKFFDVNNYKRVDNYVVDDIYYVPNEMDLKLNSLEVLKKSILVRSIDDKKHYLMYKYKEYDANEFLKTMGYKELIRIVDYIDVYEKEGLQICVEDVNDKYLFIEIEENEKYNTMEKMINALESTGINYDKNNYFVKKAKIIFEEKYRNN